MFPSTTERNGVDVYQSRYCKSDQGRLSVFCLFDDKDERVKKKTTTVRVFNEEVVRRPGIGMLDDVDPQRTSYLWHTQQETKR